MGIRRFVRFFKRLARKHFFSYLPAPTKVYLIITRGRSGSNFLLSLLGSHPSIKRTVELFGESRLRKPDVMKDIIKCGSVPYLESYLKVRLFKPVVGLKILYHQLEENYARRWGINDLGNILDYLKSNKVIKVIHLKRRDRFRWMVSIKMAGKSKVYAIRDDSKRDKDITVELFKDECLKYFKEVEEWEKRYDDFFKVHSLLEVYYEDLATDTQAECDRILDFLGVYHRELKADTRKQNIRPLSEVIENYQEL
ncbi:MAG: Stf0 family sulfotransferase [Planctomycetota bacterium]|jgi:LPS sulfotransferase NodH